MLEHVFGSRTRVKLLTLFAHHPEEAFFVRELTRRIGTQINAVRREIQNLLVFGYIVEGQDTEDAQAKRAGVKRKYYKANRMFPLFQDIQGLLTKSYVFFEWKIEEQLSRLGKIEYLALMGRFVGLPGSGVDVLIVGSVEPVALKKIMGELEKELGIEINYTCLQPHEFIYRRELTDRFLMSLLQAPKQVLINTIDDRARTHR